MILYFIALTGRLKIQECLLSQLKSKTKKPSCNPPSAGNCQDAHHEAMIKHMASYAVQTFSLTVWRENKPVNPFPLNLSELLCHQNSEAAPESFSHNPMNCLLLSFVPPKAAKTFTCIKRVFKNCKRFCFWSPMKVKSLWRTEHTCISRSVCFLYTIVYIFTELPYLNCHSKAIRWF